MPLHAQITVMLLGLHLLAAAAWVGGMAALHFAVRPAVQQVLETPPPRLQLMAAALTRFIKGIGHAIALLWLSGLAMLSMRGLDVAVPWPVHAMVGIASFMTVIYVQIRWQLLPRLRSAVALSQWPTGADALARIRVRVVLNLALGALVLLIAPWARLG